MSGNGEDMPNLLLEQVKHKISIEFSVNCPVELVEKLVPSLRDEFHQYWWLAARIQYSFNNPKCLSYPEISIERL